MAKDPWSRPSSAAELIQAASRALSSSASSIPAPAAASPDDGASDRAERERRVQTTKVPAIGAESGSPEPAAAGSAEAARARAGVTRQVSRPHFEPAASSAGGAPVIEDEPAAAVHGSSETAAEPAPLAVLAGTAGLPNRLVALVAALTLAAFALGFVLGLIVH
jgi:hypothetical protein